MHAQRVHWNVHKLLLDLRIILNLILQQLGSESVVSEKSNLTAGYSVNRMYGTYMHSSRRDIIFSNTS
jgi:hypothetical protein